MKNQRRTRGRQGFSLLEVVFAMFLLGVGAAALAGLIAFMIQASQTSRYITEATSAARDKLEELQDLGYPSVSGSGAERAGNIDLSWEVIQASGDVKRLEVQADWANAQGRTGRVSLSCFLADRFTMYVPPLYIVPPGTGATKPELVPEG